MFDEPEIAVMWRKSVRHLISVDNDHLGLGSCSFQNKSHDEIRFDQPIVCPVRDPSEMDVQDLAFVDRKHSDCHRCAGKPENFTYGILRIGEMRIEYLLETVLPFSFSKKHSTLERLEL